MKTIEDAFKALMQESAVDYVGLWEIASCLKDNLGIDSATEVKKNRCRSHTV